MTIIYCGKLSHLPYATSSIITVIAPDGILDGKPCVILWQWAVTSTGIANLNMEFTGKFIEKVAPMVECRNSSDSNHWFTWNLRTNEMLMMSAENAQYGRPITLEKVYPVGMRDSVWLLGH